MLRVACLFIHVCTYTYMYMGIYPRSVTSFYSLCSKHQSDPLKQINYVMLYTCLPWWPLRKRYPHQSKGLQTRNLFCIKFVLFIEWLFFIMPYCLFKYNAWCNTWCQINCFQVQVQIIAITCPYCDYFPGYMLILKTCVMFIFPEDCMNCITWYVCAQQSGKKIWEWQYLDPMNEMGQSRVWEERLYFLHPACSMWAL